jgi:hypothetical protein
MGLGPNFTLKILGNAGCLIVIETINAEKAENFRKYFISFLSQYGIFTRGYINFCDVHSNEDIQYVCDAVCCCIKSYANLSS